MWKFLKGKKTYILALVGAVWAIVGYSLGYLDSDTAMRIFWEALGAASIRHAID